MWLGGGYLSLQLVEMYEGSFLLKTDVAMIFFLLSLVCATSSASGARPNSGWF